MQSEAYWICTLSVARLCKPCYTCAVRWKRSLTMSLGSRNRSATSSRDSLQCRNSAANSHENGRGRSQNFSEDYLLSLPLSPRQEKGARIPACVAGILLSWQI